MKITIYGKQMSVRESLKASVEKKLRKFDKFFGEDTEAFVTCRVRKGVKIIEITVNYGGAVFRCEEESDTFITALDRAIEGLERQIRKNKTRLEKRWVSLDLHPDSGKCLHRKGCCPSPATHMHARAAPWRHLCH